MKVRYLLAAAVSALITLLPCGADDLETVFETVLSNDPSVRTLGLALERTELGIERSRNADSLDLAVGTDDSGIRMLIDYSETGSTTLTADPGVSITLGNPPGTVFSMESDLTIPFGGAAPTFAPVFGVRQTLNNLSPGNPRRQLTELNNRIVLTEARNRLADAKRNAKRRALSQVKVIYDIERSLADTRRSISRQEARIEEGETLGTLTEGSAQYLTLRNTLNGLQRSLERLETRSEDARERFETVTGVSFASLPNEISAVDLGLPRTVGPEENPGLYLKTLALEKFRVNSLVENESSYGVSAGYDVNAKSISAGVSAGLPRVSLSGVVSADLDDKIVGASLFVNWSLNGARGADIDSRVAEISVESAEIELEAALTDAGYTLRDLYASIVEMEDRATALSEAREAAAARLGETRRLYDEGIANLDELEDAQWGSEVLVYDVVALAIDRILLSLDIEAFSGGIE